MRLRRSGFTLVEILIVVIILGILAAIVIPQFTNASQDARKNSLTSQLQTVRAQLELYKLQHLDELPPSLDGSTASPACWEEMTFKTDVAHNTGTGNFGPYLQAPPANPLNGKVDVAVVSGTTDFGSGGGSFSSGTAGFVLNTTTGKIWATSAKNGFIYNEGDPTDPNNDD